MQESRLKIHEKIQESPSSNFSGHLLLVRDSLELADSCKLVQLRGKYHESSSLEFKDDFECGSECRRGILERNKFYFNKARKFSKEEPTLKKGVCPSFQTIFKRPFSVASLVQRPDKDNYFCQWYPKLFGIDEDDIPSSGDEEGSFDMDLNDLEIVPVVGTELERPVEIGKNAIFRYQYPKYGRRARTKPILERENHKEFECICNIDVRYSRHYIPRYGGGVVRSGEELKIPHFKTYWEDFYSQAQMDESDRWSKIFDTKSEEPEEMEGVFYHPVPKFQGSSKKDQKKVREQLLSGFRPLNSREVRRFRIPYAEALYLELQEDNYLQCAEFFKYLIIKDYFVHKSVNKTGQSLRDNVSMINKIINFIKLGEKFCRREEYHKEALVYLRSGKFFNDHDSNWWWLAEEFYKKAVAASKNSVIDGGKMEAISNYILGTFLLDFVQRVQPAQEHLQKARELSMGKDWSAKNILQREQDTVYKECANYLCRALIAVSKELRIGGKPEEALPLIRRSQKLCEESKTSRWDIEMETLFELGMTYQAVGYLDWAKIVFRKFIEMAIAHNCPRRICDGYLETAICFKSEGDLEHCLNSLHSYLRTAEKREDENLTAFAHRYIGEFHLDNGNSKLAAEHFKYAFYSLYRQYEEAGKMSFEEWKPEHFVLSENVELTRVLTGLAEGELLTRPICQLILEAKDNKKHEKFLKLINWKCGKEKIKEWEAYNFEELPEFATENDIHFNIVSLGKGTDSSENSKISEELKIVRFAI